MKNAKTIVVVQKSEVKGHKRFTIGNTTLTLPVKNKTVEREIVVRLIAGFIR